MYVHLVSHLEEIVEESDEMMLERVLNGLVLGVFNKE